jgi:murein DD-endopeptidase MepM/ murein hydrolase activator NlpD
MNPLVLIGAGLLLSTPSGQAEFREWKRQNPEVVAAAARTQQDLQALWLEAKRGYKQGYAQGKARSAAAKKAPPPNAVPAPASAEPAKGSPETVASAPPPVPQEPKDLWHHLRRAYTDAKARFPDGASEPGGDRAPPPAPAPAPAPLPAPVAPKPKPPGIDLTFPVKGPHSYGDTWGAPRMVGTRWFHRHQGTDIFAPKGTPVVAVTDGKLERVGPNTLGGNRLWLRSSDDSSYYYAHLDGYANRIRDGTEVRRDETLGYVGNTGNASRAPPHLHFEVHFPGGGPVNPFPILKKIEGKR